jgi:exopolyphosphatase/guanosine-5'-triphosphate,3'-diphosphate pyrophosphatase
MASPEPAGETARTVGVIDIGSNSVRMVVAQVSPDGEIEVLERTQRPVRLGHSTFLTGRLSRPAMNAAIAILRDFRRIMDGYPVERVRTVATSAVREASNADAFGDRVAMAVNLDVEVIEPTEESRLTVSAVRQAVGGALGVNRGKTLVVEVGGGSALLTILRSGQIAATESYALGSIRLQEMLATARESPERAAELLRHHLANATSLMKRSMALGEVDTVLAVGGDARFAAQQVGKPVSGSNHLFTVTAGDLNRLIDQCAPRAAEDIARTYGLPFETAETLVPALLAYQAILQSTRAKRMIVTMVSMRDGLVLDLARQATGVEDLGLTRSIIRSATTVGRKYRYDPRHAAHVAHLATRLFDELQVEHGLRPRYRLLLHLAGLLHEIGRFVSNRAHHKHSQYLIANTELFGVRRDELRTVAHVARYHRRSPPRPTHVDYMSLPRESRIIVNKLAAILRVADALDRGQAQQIRDFRIERRPDELVIYVSGLSDLGLERRALAAKADLFEDTYGLTVRLEEAGSTEGATERAEPIQ